MTNITTLQPGEHFMFKSFEWVCLDPNHPDGGLLAIMAEPWGKNIKFYKYERHADEKGNLNNYRTSLIREVLNNSLADELGDNLLLHTVDLVADNGDRAYGTVQDSVFILTCDEYRKYRDYIPHYDSWIWTATPWYCGGKDFGHVRCVSVGGKLRGDETFMSHAVVPVCVLNPKSLNLRQGMAYAEEVSE